ncbi:FAD-dependent oxidoreductase [Anaerosalibacter bizertensis]|uniref:FAD-dependent oxidoreductase n=1 Tax=Anaerosalibacter bizertensis TaxID=932217 RepID=UPI001C0F051C|nr:FAD-dependent oxidoreductase [Anaerosalibacter bizertensis]MBU5292939.1 FAD-dependent oxidoreductase [Anaerosalibacter bizertensis]
MKILIIGGVAAGTKVAAKLKRENRGYDVKLFTDSKDISYAGCGLPYYVGQVIKDKEELIVNTPESFSELTGVEVFTETKVTKINPEDKTIEVTDLNTNENKEYTYDKLVIATGASPIKPPLEGMDLDGIFFMRTPEDAITLREEIEELKPRRATVVGGGFIGLEVAENLAAQGIITTVIDMAETIPPGFDKEMTDYILNHLFENRIMVFTGTKLESIIGENGRVKQVKTDRNKMNTDLVVLSIGIRANTKFLDGTGIELMPNGTVKVNEYLETNIPDIYAVGDCATVSNRITKKPAWSPMGSTANISGRIAAMNINGKEEKYNGALGTAVAQLPGLNIGRTGLTEDEAKSMGYDAISVVTVVDDKAHYFPGSSAFIIKMTADKNTKKLLGLQVLGLDRSAVDKIVDIAVTAISLDGSLEDIKDLDLAYAPPFSTAIHPFAHTVNVLLNKISGDFVTATPREFSNGDFNDYKLIDASITPKLSNATYVDLPKVNGEIKGFDKDDKMLICCDKGKRAYLLQNRLKHYGYENTVVLEGGSILNNIK